MSLLHTCHTCARTRVTVVNARIKMAMESSFTPSSITKVPGINKEQWESRYHWLCRRKFIEDHKNMYPPERLVCLSMVWANMNFLSSNYSESIEHLVSYYPVPEKNELNRWLSAHSEIQEEEESRKKAREDEMKITSKRSIGVTDSGPVAKQPKIDPMKEPVGSKRHDSLSYNDITQQLSAIISVIKNKEGSTTSSVSLTQSLKNDEIFKNPRWKKLLKLLCCWCLCPKCFGGSSTNSVLCLNAICGKSKLTLEYEEKCVSSSESMTNVLVDGVCMSSVSGFSKDSRVLAAQLLMDEIQQHQNKIGFECPALGRRVVELDEIAKGQIKDERISEDNKGHQMLLKMGWSGDQGLGTHGQGNQDPVGATIVTKRDREGFGAADQSKLSKDVIKSMLHDFLASEETQLEFSPDLASEDRKTVHLLAEQYNLIHKSLGNGSGRFLVIIKKTGFNYQNEIVDTAGVGGPIRHGNESRYRLGKPY